jgi:hypothetical protein
MSTFEEFVVSRTGVTELNRGVAIPEAAGKGIENPPLDGVDIVRLLVEVGPTELEGYGMLMTAVA